MTESETNRRSDTSIYALLIVIALAITAGRIAVVASKEGTTAFLSANDRSRWATIACLVEQGTYAIDRQIAITDPIKRNRRPWNSIDKVRHIGRDGKQHYYSSKPPLLPTIIAGVYWLVNAATGMTLTDQPIYLARIMLGLVNLPLLATVLICTIASIHRLISNSWARRFAAACCCFGTMLMPFTIALNNHLPAAAATALAMCIYLIAADRLRCAEASTDTAESGSTDPNADSVPDVPWAWWFIAGVAAAMAAANELPALSMMVFWWGLFLLLSRRSVVPMTLGIMVVAAGFFGTNWIAHQSLRPAYAHRGNGEVIQSFQRDGSSETPDAMLPSFVETLRDQELVDAQLPIELDGSDEAGRWIVRAGEHQQFAVLQTETGWDLAKWDDWYEYPGTYWRPENLRGVDRGEPSRLVYFANMTIGHYGLFSLTPIWWLMPIGLCIGLTVGSWAERRMVAAVLVASAVCTLFYLARPEIDRNYGGVSVCFRWLLWFAPLWLMASAVTLQKIAGARSGRGIATCLLALSVFSMSTALSSPWQSPWLYRFWQFLGWIEV